MKAILYILGTAWIIFGGLGTMALISGYPGDELNRAPFTLMLGLIAVIIAYNIKRKGQDVGST